MATPRIKRARRTDGAEASKGRRLPKCPHCGECLGNVCQNCGYRFVGQPNRCPYCKSPRWRDGPIYGTGPAGRVRRSGKAAG